MKIIFYILSLLISLLVLFFFLIVLLIHPEDYKKEIINYVEGKINYDLVIEGEIKLDLFPFPRVSISKVELNYPNSKDKKNFVRVGEIYFLPSIMSLLYGELLIDKMHLDNLNINYIQGQDDLKNWKKSLIGNTKDEYSKEGFIDDDNFKDNQKNEKGINNKYRRIKINNLVISHSELNYYKNTKETIEIKNINLRANLNEDYTYLLKGDFKYTDKLIRYDCFVEKNDNHYITLGKFKTNEIETEIKGKFYPRDNKARFVIDLVVEDLAKLVSEGLEKKNNLTTGFNFLSDVELEIVDKQFNLILNNTDIKIGKSNLSGSMELKLGDELLLTSNLSSKKFDLNDLNFLIKNNFTKNYINFSNRKSISKTNLSTNERNIKENVINSAPNNWKNQIQVFSNISFEIFKINDFIARNTNIKIELSDGVLNINELNSNFPGQTVFKVKSSKKNNVINGIAEIKSTNFRELLGFLKIDLSNFRKDKLRLGKINTQFKYINDKIYFNEIQALLDQSTFLGKAQIDLSNQKNNFISIQAEELNLDSYLENENYDKNTLFTIDEVNEFKNDRNELNSAESTNKFNFESEVILSNLTFKNRNYSDLYFKGIFFPDYIDINNLTLNDIYEGKIKFTGKVSKPLSDKNLNGVLEFENIDLNQIY